MKAFIILSNNSPSKNGMLVPMISAFVGVESIGIAEDVVEAVDIIHRRFPDILIFNEKILEEKGHGYLASILENEDPFIMLPKQREFQGSCIYLGVDFSASEHKEWILNGIGEAIREYQHFTAK